MKIHFADSQYDIDPEFKRKYVAEIKHAYKEVSKLLPFGSKHVNFFIHPREWGLIPETQDLGVMQNSEFIVMAFNPVVSEEVSQKILSNVRPTVFHEVNHATRFNLEYFYDDLLGSAVLEGLGTTFERDYAGSDPLYGKYPAEVEDWLQDLIKHNTSKRWNDYKFKHPDGRRWIIYKVGVYIIDQAMEKSNKSLIELTRMECEEILRLAGVNVPAKNKT